MISKEIGFVKEGYIPNTNIEFKIPEGYVLVKKRTKYNKGKLNEIKKNQELKEEFISLWKYDYKDPELKPFGSINTIQRIVSYLQGTGDLK